MNTLSYDHYNERSFAIRGDRKKYGKKIRDIGGRWNPRMKNGEGWLIPKENIQELTKLINSVTTKNDLDTSETVETEAEPETEVETEVETVEVVTEVGIVQLRTENIHLVEKKLKQDKYHRETSERMNSDFQSDNESSTNSENKTENFNSLKNTSERDSDSNTFTETSKHDSKKSVEDNTVEKKKMREKKKLTKQETVSNVKVLKYYKSFSEKPSAFKEMYESEICSSDEDPSDEDPSDEDPSDEDPSDEDPSDQDCSDDFPTPVSPKKKAYKKEDDDYFTLFNKVNELQRRIYSLELKTKK